MKHITPLFFLIFATYIFSAGDGAPCGDYGECDSFKPDLWNNESLQKGFSTYINYCYGCHSLKYSRWNRIATDLDIPEDLMFKYLIFDSEVKSGDLMTGSMIMFNAEQWFGVAPPDLTLVTRAHSPEWVYTYLRTFYEDESKQYGVNNLVYPGAAMPNVLLSLQGQQILGCKDILTYASNGGVKRDEKGNNITEERCGYLLSLNNGQLSTEEFDQLIYDLTNFLTYVGEPAKRVRERMGWYVIFFFIIFTALAHLLYREYQKDYH